MKHMLAKCSLVTYAVAERESMMESLAVKPPPRVVSLWVRGMQAAEGGTAVKGWRCDGRWRCIGQDPMQLQWRDTRRRAATRCAQVKSSSTVTSTSLPGRASPSLDSGTRSLGWEEEEEAEEEEKEEEEEAEEEKEEAGAAGAAGAGAAAEEEEEEVVESEALLRVVPAAVDGSAMPEPCGR
jgi:hypothetical protein